MTMDTTHATFVEVTNDDKALTKLLGDEVDEYTSSHTAHWLKIRSRQANISELYIGRGELKRLRAIGFQLPEKKNTLATRSTKLP